MSSANSDIFDLNALFLEIFNLVEDGSRFLVTVSKTAKISLTATKDLILVGQDQGKAVSRAHFFSRVVDGKVGDLDVRDFALVWDEIVSFDAELAVA